MNWWIIGILVILAIFLFKAKEIRHRMGMIVVILLLVFLVVSFGQLYSTHDLDLGSFEGITKAGKVYVSWLGNAFKNIGKIGGYAVKQSWDVNSTVVNATIGK